MVGSGRGGRAASARPLFIKIGSAGDILGFVIEKEREEVTRGRRRSEGRLLREVVLHRVRDKVSLDQGYAMPSSSFSLTGDAMRSSSATSSTRCGRRCTASSKPLCLLWLRLSLLFYSRQASPQNPPLASHNLPHLPGEGDRV